jgi:hypothetical protein
MPLQKNISHAMTRIFGDCTPPYIQRTSGNAQRLFLELGYLGHDVVSRRLESAGLRFYVETKEKQTATVQCLTYNYEIFMLSLCSLRPACLKSKLKNQMARIKEINFDLYE